LLVPSLLFLTSPVRASTSATKSSHTPCFFILWHFLETTAESDYSLRYVCMSVCRICSPVLMEQLRSPVKDFCETVYLELLLKICQPDASFIRIEEI
jgi:hypothetical protein